MAQSGASQPRPRETRVLEPDGVLTVLHDFGGEGTILLFAHATGMHGWIWKPVVDHLVDQARCVAIDLRGHGDSTMPADFDLTWNGFGRDVLAALHVLGDAEIIGVGHSLGGAALLMAELEVPGSFQRLFLYEPAVHAQNIDGGGESLLVARDTMVDLTNRRRARFASRAEAFANYASKTPMAQFQAAALTAYVDHGFTAQTGDGNEGVVLKCRPDTEARIYAAYDPDIAARLHEITCPVTVVTGSESDALQRGTVEVLARQFDSPPVVLSGVDHFGPMQQPKQFAEALLHHLDGHWSR
jgi:pimeloyl-ACP methyl ester carboxylesterase